jgi:hypothetical protein
MSQVAPATPTTAAKQSTLVALIRGRISARRRITTKDGALFITIVRLPAPDEYTSPQTVELRSRQAVGAPGEDWEGHVRIGGFARSYQAADPETGDKRTVATADNTLSVVE